MAMITLQNSSDTGITVLTNNFIDNYMPEANGEFVKVYIYLLRLLSATSIPRPEILGEGKTSHLNLSGQ